MEDRSWPNPAMSDVENCINSMAAFWLRSGYGISINLDTTYDGSRTIAAFYGKVRTRLLGYPT